jgi:hypothetical protein
VDDPPVQDEAHHHPDGDRAEHEEQALPELVEMLDERCFLAVVEATR